MSSLRNKLYWHCLGVIYGMWFVWWIPSWWAVVPFLGMVVLSALISDEV